MSARSLAFRGLRKSRYLAQRVIRLALLSAWAVLLSPLTLGARALLAANSPTAALVLARRAESRNPYTPGLSRLLVRLCLATGDARGAAAAATAWARSHNRWDALTYGAWSGYLLQLPGWSPRVELPASDSEKAGSLDLRGISRIPVGRAAASGYDRLATELVASLRQPPAIVQAAADDPVSLALADAISNWCGAAIEVNGQ